jgi:hypothetical protein
MNILLHQSGRTTRKLEEALHAARDSPEVYFLVGDYASVRYTEQRLLGMCSTSGFGRMMGKIRVSTPRLAHFDWSNMRVPGTSPDCVVLLDHAVVEERILELRDQITDLAKEIGQLYPLTT